MKSEITIGVIIFWVLATVCALLVVWGFAKLNESVKSIQLTVSPTNYCAGFTPDTHCVLINVHTQCVWTLINTKFDMRYFMCQCGWKGNLESTLFIPTEESRPVLCPGCKRLPVVSPYPARDTSTEGIVMTDGSSVCIIHDKAGSYVQTGGPRKTVNLDACNAWKYISFSESCFHSGVDVMTESLREASKREYRKSSQDRAFEQLAYIYFIHVAEHCVSEEKDEVRCYVCGKTASSIMLNSDGRCEYHKFTDHIRAHLLPECEVSCPSCNIPISYMKEAHASSGPPKGLPGTCNYTQVAKLANGGSKWNTGCGETLSRRKGLPTSCPCCNKIVAYGSPRWGGTEQ